MARHRSPQGRRPHLGFPLSSPAAATAGAGAASRQSFPSLPSRAQDGSGVSLPVRFVATAVAGSALAAAGQLALSEAIPSDGTNVLRLAADQLFSPDAAAADTVVADAPVVDVVDPLVPAVSPVAPELVVADGAALVKSADLNRAAADAEAARLAEQARLAEEARLAEQARLAEEAREAELSVAASGGVQMITGRITSGFGARWGTSHQGLDIAAPIGTPIYVPLDGTVIDSGPASGFGQWVRVEHEDGTITVYGHISRSYVSVGEQVSAGEEIAAVGNEGRSTGPHLHFEVITPGGTKINPRPWLDERGIGLT